MTDQESILEAERSVTLVLEKSDPRHSFMVTEAARLIRYWYREGYHRAIEAVKTKSEEFRIASHEAEYKIEDKT